MLAYADRSLDIGVLIIIAGNKSFQILFLLLIFKTFVLTVNLNPMSQSPRRKAIHITMLTKFFFWITRHYLKNVSCATEVILKHALQLVASKLPGKVVKRTLQLTYSHYAQLGRDKIPVATLVSLSKPCNYKCVSPPRGKWVPVWAEMVLVIDLAE